jgi:ferritin
MINTVVVQALEEQLTTERQNAAVYDALAGYAENANYSGTAKWMRSAAEDERKHADLVVEHLIDRGVAPVYGQLAPVDILPGDDLIALFDTALALEFATTEKIVTLYYVAQQAEDPQALAWLQDAGGGFSFLVEQTKSEKEIRDLLTTLRRVDNGTGWFVFDNSL